MCPRYRYVDSLRRVRLGFLLTIFIAAVASASPAVAQAPADPPSPDPGALEPGEVDVEPGRERPPEVEEITVTGTRSDATDIQSEAQAITAFSMEELDRANIINVDQLAFNVPALHVGQQGANSIITLRGISTENASITGEPGIAFHVDGVSYGRPAAARVAFFDLEGLQVLRGPQGTLGGKNATAGWIHAITRKPTDEFALEGDVQWGAYDQLRLRAALNLPFSEYAQTRLALYREDRDGFQRNLLLRDDDRDAFDADDFGWRGHLKLLPRDDLEVLFTYNYYEMKGVGFVAELVGLEPQQRCNPIPVFLGGTGYNPLTRFPPYGGCAANPDRISFPFRVPAPIYAATGFDLDQDPQFEGFENPETAHIPREEAERATYQPHETYLDRASGQDNKFWGFSSTLTWQTPALPLLGETQLKSLAAFQVTALDSFLDADATDIALFFGGIDEQTEQWSYQLEWSGSGDRVDWQASLFWARESSDSEIDFFANIGSLKVVEIDQQTENQSYGAALSTTWQLRDGLALSLGGRYIKDYKRNNLLRDNPSGGPFNFQLSTCRGRAEDLKGTPAPRPNDPDFEGPDGVPDLGVPWCDETFRHAIGDLTLEWWPTDESLVYGKVASGFKAGGFSTSQFGGYDPEYIWSFSLGSKNRLFDDRLTLNAEAYFYHYRDMQLVLVDGLAFRTDNADAEVRGLDLEFRAEPFPGLRLNGNASYMDTEFTDYVAVDPIDVPVATSCRTILQFRFLRPEEIPAPGCVRTDYSGKELSRAPEWMLTLGAEYEIDLGRFGTLTPRIQYYWQDDTWYRGFNRTAADSGENTVCPVPGGNEGACRGGLLLNAADARDLQPAYHHTDIKLIWAPPGERWSFEAFVRNLEDKVVYQNVRVSTPLLGSPQFAWYGSPRVYGFRVGYRY